MRSLIKTYSCVGVIVFFYIAVIFILPKNVFWIIDGGNRFLLVQNLIEKGYSDFFIAYPGITIDKDLMFTPFENHFIKNGENFFSAYSFVFPLMSSFFFKFFSYPGLYVIPLLSSLFLLFVSVKMYYYISGDNDNWSVALIIGLCSPVFFYSLVFWEISLFTFLITFSIFMILKFNSTEKNKYIFTAAIINGLAVWIRADGYLFSIALVIGFLYIYGFNKNIILFFLTLLITLIPLWVLNHNIYGHFLGNRFLNLMRIEVINPLSSFHVENNNFIFSFIYKKVLTLFDMLFRTHKNNAYSFIISLPFVCFPFLSFIYKKRLFSCSGNAFIIGLLVILFSEGAAILLIVQNKYPVLNTFNTQGLLLAVPYSIFFFFSFEFCINDSGKRKNDRIFLLIVIIFYILFFSIINPNKKGLIWGPRFLLPIIPVIIILSFAGFKQLSREWKSNIQKYYYNIIVVLLVSLSFIYQCYGIKLLYDKKVGTVNILNKVREVSHQHIITDIFWLPQELSSLFYDKIFLAVSYDDDIIELITRFRKTGVYEFSIVVSKFYSENINFNQIFGEKLFALEKLDIKLIENSRELISSEKLKSFDIELINYTIVTEY